MEKNTESCKLKRWDLLKTQLNNLAPREAQQFLAAHPDCVIIDCRQPAEFARGHFPNAINIDYLAYDFWLEIKELPADKPYFVYCNSCRRSTRACTLMKNGGFTEVYNLDGGLNRWLAALGSQGLVQKVN